MHELVVSMTFPMVPSSVPIFAFYLFLSMVDLSTYLVII
jgi:hypothetical protein